MARLRHHSLDGGPGLGEVVRRRGKLGGEGRGDVLQIGQPDVDRAAPRLHALHRLVAAGVADDGQTQPLGPGNVQRRDDPGPPLAGGDEVDVVGALLLQIEENFGQMLYRDLFAQSLGADGVILAETTLEGAAREKHGAAASGAADAGLFPEVQGRAGGFQGAARPAEACLPGGTVCAAAAGAEGTGDRRRCGNVFRHIVQLL